MIKNIFRAFPRLRQGRALARQSSALLACGLLATIPNAFLSCKGKDTTNNSGLQAASAAKNTEAVADMNTSSQPLVSPGSNTGNSKVDLDLTKMSATMIYTTIFDMLVMPEDYVEKNIKVKGWFETYTDPYTGEIYYAVVVPDATACCQQGLEFIWPGNHTYPDDFPKPGEDITITGLYKITEIDGVTYNYLEATSVDF
ncbi:hypothetical protein SAMN04487977_104122 [Treponema bryantii]|uniref:Uncharacterized protein n=2 Tax=Treponema bryantii TaxID=163 RepID=A0A1H9FRL2_9SPIR|nr:hypothetical protein SAMN04487977_104122 [Treponema bryantii]